MPRLPKNTEIPAALPSSDEHEVASGTPDVAVAAVEPLPDVAAAAPLIKARVLVSCAFGGCDDVIEVDAAVAEKHADVIDTNPAAVAYAESLAAQ